MKRTQSFAVVGLLMSMLAVTVARADEIVIGQTLPLTGGQASMATAARSGAEAYIQAVNKKGGVSGRKLVLKTVDDEFNPEKAAANVRDLATKEGAVGIISIIGGPTALAVVPVATALDLPIVGVMNGNAALRTDKTDIITHVRATFTKELEVIVRHYTTSGQDRFAVFYPDDVAGKAAAANATTVLAAKSLKPAGLVAFDRAAKEYKPYATQLAASKAQVVIIVSPTKPAAEVIRALKEMEANVSIVCLSVVEDRALFALLGDTARGVALSSIVPNPHDVRVPLVQEYQRDMTEAGHFDFSIASLEGYANAKVMVAALKNVKATPGKTALRKSLKSLHDLDLGGPHLITSAEPARDGLDSVEIVMLSRGGRLIR